MLPNKIYISQRATEILANVKGRTGITPNILCRLAIANALESGSLKRLVDSKPGVKELNINTLLGEYAELYAMLIRQELPDADLGKVITQLVDDGLGLFSGINSLSDLFEKCKGKVA